MSVSAFDQLLLSAAGKPSLSSASKKRELFFTTSASASSRLDQALGVHQRMLAQAKQRNSSMQRTRAISPRSYGKSSALSRTVLSAFKGDQLVQLEAAAASAGDASISGVFSIDSKVKLFFDGIAPDAESETKAGDQARRRGMLSWPRLPSPVKLLRRRQAKNDTLVVHRPVATVRVSHQELLNRQIERVRWRRRSSSQPRQRSASGGARSHRRSRISSSHDDEADGQRSQARRESAGARVKSSVAAESNARLSLELMERKYKTTPQWHDPQYYSGWITTRSDSVDEEVDQETSAHAHQIDGQEGVTTELQALRGENAEQKALIRHLLIENRRLLDQSSMAATSKASPSGKKPKRERPEDSDEGSSDSRDRGVSVASTSTSSMSALWTGEMDRRPSLTFAIVDGKETMIDHKFEELVADITAELAELLGEDSSSSVTSTTSSRSSSLHNNNA